MKNNKIMYSNCTSLTTIPYNLFSSGITSSFGDNLFSNCTSLTTIPYNLFSSGTTSFFGDNLLNDRKIKITKINNIIKNKKYQKIIDRLNDIIKTN